MYSIEFTRKARKTLKAVPRNVRELVLGKIDDLALDHDAGAQREEAGGPPGLLASGSDWRVIYALDAGRLVVRVLDIGARGGVHQ